MARRASADLGAALRERRLALGMSQRDVEAACQGGLSAAALSRIEKGDRSITLRTAEVLSVALRLRFVTAEGATRVEIG